MSVDERNDSDESSEDEEAQPKAKGKAKAAPKDASDQYQKVAFPCGCTGPELMRY